MLVIAFFLAFFAFLAQALWIPNLSVLAFIPFIALAMLKRNLHKALWWAATAGTIVDCLSEDPIGLHALNYVLIAFLFWRFRRLFSATEPLHLSILSALMSSTSTLFQWMLLFLFDRRVPFSGKWLFVDVAVMPAVDALYAFVWFTAPIFALSYVQRIGKVFWLNNRSRILRSKL